MYIHTYVCYILDIHVPLQCSGGGGSCARCEGGRWGENEEGCSLRINNILQAMCERKKHCHCMSNNDASKDRYETLRVHTSVSSLVSVISAFVTLSKHWFNSLCQLFNGSL